MESAEVDPLIRQGMAHVEQGELEVAVASFQKAVRLDGGRVAAHFHLASALAQQGKTVAAIASYREALRISPDHFESLVALGVSLARSGQLSEGIDTLGRAVATRPNFAKAHLNLGVALAESNRLDEATDSLQRALELNPEYAEAHFNLGNVLAQQGRREEAVARLERVLELKPDHADALNNLGLALVELGRFARAVIVLKQAVRLRKDHVEAWNNLGLAFAGQGSFEAAIEAYEAALALNPRHIDAHNNLGSAYKDLGRLEEAAACYQQAIWLDPANASSRWNRSLVWLQMGDFGRGWHEYEWRWKRKNSAPPAYRQPRWDGAPLAGRTILLHGEQGLGDMIQFIRYADLVQRTAGKVVVACPRCLRRIFSSMSSIDRFVHEGEELPHFDVHAPLMSLPLLMGTTASTIPAQTPYLAPDSESVKHWKERLREPTRYRIGIAWQGNPRHRLDRHRSVPLAAFEPIAALPNVELISLQQGDGAEDVKDHRQFPIRVVFDDPAAPLADFAEVAAVIQNLNLVVSADTAIAHLAGAVGASVYLALAAVCDWRWQLHRSDSSWYPTMTLFRQTQLDRWNEVFERMAESIRQAAGLRTEKLD
jgi:tetratricopeptide (TPR) repeat protein